MFGKKKKEEPKIEEPKTDTIEMQGKKIGQEIHEEPTVKQPKLGSAIMQDFLENYDGIYCIRDLAAMPQAERQALEINVLMAIYGELRLIRDISNRQG